MNMIVTMRLVTARSVVKVFLQNIFKNIQELLRNTGVIPKQKKLCNIKLPRPTSHKQIARAIARIFDGENFPSTARFRGGKRSIGDVDHIDFRDDRNVLNFWSGGFIIAAFDVSPQTFNFLKKVYGSVGKKKSSAFRAGTFTLDVMVHTARFGIGF